MKRPEQSLQQAVAAYLRLALPRGAFFTAFPAGGGGKVRGAILKSMGLVAGVPDLLIIYRGTAHFVELKTPRGRISVAQISAHVRLRTAGAEAYVCRSVEEVEEMLRLRRIPLKASVSREPASERSAAA